MTTTVTVSEFRDNLAKYLNLLKAGHFVELTDGRTKRTLLEIKRVKKKKFDWDTHFKFIESMAGSGLLISKEDEEARKKLRRNINKRLSDLRKIW